MAYKQNAVPKKCEICQNQIEQHAWMFDLFREESSRSAPETKLRWVHVDCAREAVETWLRKKWAREAAEAKCAEAKALQE